MKHAWLVTTAFVGLSGCSSSAEESVKSTSSGGASNSGTGGVNRGNTGGGAVQNNSGGAPGAGGNVQRTGGTGGLNNNSPTGGTPSAASGATTGGTSGDVAIAQGLNHRWEVPCTDPGDAEVCPAAMMLPPEEITFGGSPQKTYKVTLHFRGLTEPHTFLDPNGQRITTVTAAPYFLDSAQGEPEPSNYTTFWIDVALPAKMYYANAFHTTDEPFHHRLFALNYTAEIIVQGGSRVTLNHADGNARQVKNFENVVVDGVPPAPQVFDGQFLQVDVVSVSAQNQAKARARTFSAPLVIRRVEIGEEAQADRHLHAGIQRGQPQCHRDPERGYPRRIDVRPRAQPFHRTQASHTKLKSSEI